MMKPIQRSALPVAALRALLRALLEMSMAEISGRLNVLDERLKPVAATSVRLQEFLLEQAR